MTIGTCFTVSYGGGNMQYYKAKSCKMPIAVDGQALCDLFNALTSASRSALTNWCPGSAPYDPCVTGINAWMGVTCETIGFATRVSNLNISYKSLSGTRIPETIGYLDGLTYLNVGGNTGLNGSYPSTLGLLTRLKHLSLDHSGFIGTLPSLLGNLASVTHFDVRGNSLSGTLPSSLGWLTSLKKAWFCDGNVFTGTIPSSLGLLTGLEQIDFKSGNTCQFTNSPPASICVAAGTCET
jgi:hypothetical protein